MSRAATLALAQGHTRDEQLVLTPGDFSSCLDTALKHHSRRVPRLAVAEWAGDGVTSTHSLPSAWDVSLSVLVNAWRVTPGSRPVGLATSELWIEPTTSGLVLRTLCATPTGTTLRVLYRALHTCTSDATTVAVADQEALSLLAASYACDILATHYAKHTDTTLAADSVQHTSKSELYASRARRLHTLYSQNVPAQRQATALEVVRA
jgi:hypothetical protein